MQKTPDNQQIIRISGREHLNLTLNIHQCGDWTILPAQGGPPFIEDAFSLLMVREGTLSMLNDGITTTVGTGKGIFYFPGQKLILVNRASMPAQVVWVCFGGYLVDHYLSRANIYPPRNLFDDPDGEILRQLLLLYERSLRLPNRYCAMMSHLYSIFSSLIEQNPTRPGLISGYNDMYFVLRTIDVIENGGYRTMTVEALSDQLGVDRKHLSAAFVRVIGISTKKYIILFRIEQACTLLRETSRQISEIADAIGYGNQFHFAKEFKRITGVTPTQYRTGEAPVEVPVCTKLKEGLIDYFSGRQSVFSDRH